MNDLGIDFSMDTRDVKDQAASWLRVVFSRTIFAFHGAIVATITIVTLTVTYIR